MRSAKRSRHTTETQIEAELCIDGTGRSDVQTGIGFFDHMLQLFARHGAFDLSLKAKGDLHVDQHHTVEDVGIVLGELFDQSLGDRKGIFRTGYFVQPMDETLAVVAIDFGGRPVAVIDHQVTSETVGSFTVELLPEFFEGFARGARCNIHVKVLYGKNNHHKIEAIFKGFARAARFACSFDERLRDQLPSTKELL